jgi:hypothetical protein
MNLLRIASVVSIVKEKKSGEKSYLKALLKQKPLKVHQNINIDTGLIYIRIKW